MSAFEHLLTKEVQDFINSNSSANVQSLILNPPPSLAPVIKDIANQILSRQKAKGKLTLWASNPELILPPPLSIEQASSDKTASYKSSLVSGKHLVDLTGGMGIDSLSLSQNFDHATYVEQSQHLCEVFQHNSQVLGRQFDIYNGEAVSFLKDNRLESEPRDTVLFIDPARRDDAKNKVFKLEDCTPDISDILPFLGTAAQRILIKLSPLIDLSSLIAEFDHISEIHIVAVKNECKELLVLLDKASHSEPVIRTINLNDSSENYDFKLSEEKETWAGIGELESYLYEPNAAILKAGAFKKISVDFSLTKLNNNTHLYTSSKVIKGFPGKIFSITKRDVNKKIIKPFLQNNSINVVTRNYPLNASSLKKKLNLKDGGTHFLFGYRDHNNKAQLIVCERVN